MSEGWISVHRKIVNNWVWDDKPFSYGQAWIHLLLSANHKDKEIVFEGRVLMVKQGSFITSILKLSDVFGWNRKKTSRFLDLLEKQKMVTTDRTRHGTMISIVNYSLFQNVRTTEGATNGQQMDNHWTTAGQQFPTNNNDNNENNDNKKKREASFTPPTVIEVEEYCREKGYSIKASNFVDFYSAKGWMIGKNKMKDWKAAVRTWERRENKGNKIDKEEMNAKNEHRGPASDFYKRYMD